MATTIEIIEDTSGTCTACDKDGLVTTTTDYENETSVSICEDCKGTVEGFLTHAEGLTPDDLLALFNRMAHRLGAEECFDILESYLMEDEAAL